MTGWKVPKHRIQAKIWRNLLSSSFGGQQSPWFRPSWGCEFVFREYSDNGTRSESLYKTKTGYYDVLGLSPSATQAQIKTAYYKQSFAYHPDRNAGSKEATLRFSMISEAYTVLGNKSLRKKYDRGLLSLSDLHATNKHASAKHRDSATHQAASRPSAAGRADRLHFQEFYKGHYGKQLERERQLRAKQQEQQKVQEETFANDMDDHVKFGLLFMALIAVGILFTIK
ncbi:dnaJ homolog subfamily C member 30 [Austrofundulus limnaeus]|uniref:DnaJ homolog subfamily C member 30, mitochondrial n=1 Tax=Austrofundulus limnaeus TaxID=52670 RepID=A0A2I4BQ59_AUSLI|nr:PREDICTED: dnaJ homolog subfamily C member 30-like [Austrofundulus limnaeus]